MENNVEALLDKISAHVKEMTKTETIIGEEFQMGEYSCKPVIKVGFGFGSGMGSGDHPKGKGHGTGQGAGAGIGIAPVSFLATRGDEIKFIPADKNKGLSALLDKMPDLVDRIITIKENKESREDDKESKTKKKD